MVFLDKTDMFEVRFRKAQTNEPVRLKGLASRYGTKYMTEAGHGSEFRSSTIDQQTMENLLLTLFNGNKGKAHKKLRESILVALQWIHEKSLDQ